MTSAGIGTAEPSARSTLRPSKSLTCETMMTTPMPAVNPMVTGYGTNLITPPKRNSPSSIRMTPAIDVASTSPAYP